MRRLFATALFLFFCSSLISQKIDRRALVLQHNIIVTKVDSLSSLTLGNGQFAFTVDVTGLQTFPVNYQHGVPLSIQSELGWHHFNDTVNYTEEETLSLHHFDNHDTSSSEQWSAAEQNRKVAEWFRQNSHHLQLGNLGFEIIKKDGTVANLSDVKNVYQELNLWTGKLRSHFTVEDIPVEVATYSSGSDDAMAVKVRSQLIKDGRLKIKLFFPNKAGEWVNEEISNIDDSKYQSSIIMSHNTGAVVAHGLDNSKYYVGLKWEGGGFIEQKKSNYFLITPDDTTDLFDLTAKFTTRKDFGFLPTFIDVRTSSENQWKKFWTKCEAIDFSANNSKRSFELERRIVLSQYLMRTLDANSYAQSNKVDIR